MEEELFFIRVIVAVWVEQSDTDAIEVHVKRQPSATICLAFSHAELCTRNGGEAVNIDY